MAENQKLDDKKLLLEQLKYAHSVSWESYGGWCKRMDQLTFVLPLLFLGILSPTGTALLPVKSTLQPANVTQQQPWLIFLLPLISIFASGIWFHLYRRAAYWYRVNRKLLESVENRINSIAGERCIVQTRMEIDNLNTKNDYTENWFSLSMLFSLLSFSGLLTIHCGRELSNRDTGEILVAIYWGFYLCIPILIFTLLNRVKLLQSAAISPASTIWNDPEPSRDSNSPDREAQ